jgi:hypothetical protein
MVAFTRHSAPWGATGSTSHGVIGPDGNLWVIDGSANVFRFNTTTFATATFAAPTGTAFTDIQTDGTFLYASNHFATTSPFPTIYKVTTGGTISVFFNSAAANNGGSLYFDGTYLWLTSHNNFYQLTLAGAIVNSYGGVGNDHGGGLINTGTYWISGTRTSPNTGIARSPVVSPAWTAFSASPITTGTDNFIPLYAGGLAWNSVGGTAGTILSVVPSTMAATLYSPSALAGSSVQEMDYDGTSLWVASTVGIWQTTLGAPATGTLYSSPVGGVGSISAFTILYNAATKTLWATGVSWAYSYTFTSSGQLVMLV